MIGRFCVRLVAAWAVFLVTLPAVAAAEVGVSEDRIVFGQSAALKGPSAALGIGMRAGLLAAFAEVNQNGGIHGRRLELISYDDGYEPERAIANTTTLLDQDQVFALVGEVGTPTSKSVVPIAVDRKVPFLGPLTGAAFLRHPALQGVINVRASYNEETEAWIEYLTETLQLTRIAILYQDDSFGRAGLSGVQAALKKRGLALTAEGTYMRNTTAVKRALLAIRKGKPQAVVIVGAYKPAAAFIKLARQIDLNAIFLTLSFVGSKALSRELGADRSGVVVSQVVPSPDNRRMPLVARYRAALAAVAQQNEVGFVSLEGYVVGRMIADALDRLGPTVTRAGLIDVIRRGGDIDLQGVVLKFGPNDNQGMDDVFLTIIQPDGRFLPVDKGSRP